MPPNRNDIEDSESSAASEHDALELGDVAQRPPELEILDAPADVGSVVSLIDASAAPGAYVRIDEELEEEQGLESLDEELVQDDPGHEVGLAQEEEGIEELEDFEELDDLDLVDDDGASAAEVAEASEDVAAPPPLPPPPPAPARVGLPARPITEAAPAIEPQLIAFDPCSVLDTLLDGRQALDWKERAVKLTKELEQTEDRTRMGELSYELGELYERYLADEAGAVKAYGRALQADPSLRANLWAIRRIFYRRKLWPNLVKLISAELRFANSDRERADLHAERGRILLDEVGDASGAQISFEQALALDPEHLGALLAIERIARASGDKAKLWTTLASLGEVSGRPERQAAFLIDLARDFRLSRDHVDEARALLARAGELNVLEDQIADEREALARDTEDVSALAASLERRIAGLVASFGPAGLPSAEEDPSSLRVLRKIVAIRRHQSRVLAESGDTEGAWVCLQEALLLCPDDALLLLDLADLAEKLGRYDELAALVAARESGEVNPARALSLSLQRASALVKAGKQEEADELLRARANATPGYLPLVAAREAQAGRQSNWIQLAALQVELAEASRLGTSFGPGAETEGESEAAADHYVVAGDLLRFGSGDLDAAKSRYAHALEICPGKRDAVLALSSLYSAQGAFAELSQLLERHSETGDPGSRSETLDELCAVYLLLGQASDELSALRRLQVLHPEDLSLLRRRVELLRENAMHEELSEELALLAEREEDEQTKAALHFERGRLLSDKAGQPKQAAVCFRKCLDIWPDDEIAQECLRDALRASEDYQGLADWLAREVESSGGGEELTVLARESLAIAEFHLNQPEATKELALTLCERQPDDMALVLDAIACIEASLPASSEALVQLYEQLVALSDGDLKITSQVRLGMLELELGRSIDAEQTFREASAAGSPAAALKLYELAAAQHDASGKADALLAIAEMLENPTQKASVIEQAAWQRALALDEEMAAELFQKASVGGHGPLLGIGLLAAKLGDKDLQGESLEALASLGAGSYASSSMLLRAGMLADVAGDEPLALKRLERARLIAPQDPGTALVRADRLAPLSPEGGLTVEELLARAELCEMRSALADAGPARIDWDLERAECLERAGHLHEALESVSSVLEQRSDDIRALQLVRQICLRGADHHGLARTDLALAKLIGDSQGRLALLREAAQILDAELGDVGACIMAYRQIVEEEPGAPEYARLVELLTNHQDVRGLYRCYTARLNHLDAQGDNAGRVAILGARSQIRESIGDLLGAARDLKVILKIDSEDRDALFDRAGLLERMGEAKEAASLLQQFLAIETEPARRARAELSLSELLADSLDDLSGAIDQLEHVAAQSPKDVAVRERLVALLLKAKKDERAVEILRELGALRKSDAERARDELRIATLQSERSDRKAALESLGRARELDPLNMDVVRELVALSSSEKRDVLLHKVAQDVRAAIDKQPMEASLYERLFSVGQWSEDDYLVRQSLQALSVLGTLSTDQQRNLAALAAPLGRLGKPLRDHDWRSSLEDPDASGIAAELWALIGPAVAEIVKATPAGLGFERNQRIKAKLLAKSFPVVAEIASYAGLEIEVYVSQARVGVARSVHAELPTLCLDEGIAQAATGEQRFAIARAIAHAKLGSGGVVELEGSELCTYFAAAAQLAGADAVPTVLRDRVSRSAVEAAAKGLSKELGRRARKEIGLLGNLVADLPDPLAWRRGMQLSAARFALLVCDSLPVAFEVMDVGKGGRALSENLVAQRLVAWSVSESYTALRASRGAGEETSSDGK